MALHQSVPAILSRDVLYIGSAVPLETSEGLEAVQQPLRSRYPVDSDHNIQGILSTISILPSGIELRYKNDSSPFVSFSFSTLTMCAAVRCVKVFSDDTHELIPRFVSLSSPEAGGANSQQPAIFTMIMRRTRGRQVLECHSFITMSPKDAMDLVQTTSEQDRRSNHGALDALTTTISTNDVSRAENSFYADTSSLPDFPIQLVPGEAFTPNAASAFYKEPPRDGYFYSTKQELVKKYSLHKFTKNSGVDSTASVIPSGLEHIEKRPGYAPSHYSVNSAVYPPQPRHPVLVPVRPLYPQQVPILSSPMFMRPPPPRMIAYPRLQFFSPTPPAVRVQPVPVFVPTPVPSVYKEPHSRIRINRQESSGSSSASSVPDSPQFSGGAFEKTRLTHVYDESSESMSRPQTPPTDYDVPRLSRKEDFHLRHTLVRDLPRTPRPLPAGGYYMMPSYYGVNSAAYIDRPHSVPPYVEKVNKKSKKNKKPQTKKKEKKKVAKKSNHDESTDSVGYLSAPNIDSKQPRDFRRLENQFQHERAFSQSLAEETRHSLQGNNAFNAYSLNNTIENNENEFPPTMY